MNKQQLGDRFTASLQAIDSHLYHRRNLQPDSEQTINEALSRDAVARKIQAKGYTLQHGEVIGVRLNLNVLRSTGVLVHTIHQGGQTDSFKRGKGLYRNPVIAYLPVVTLNDAWFNVNQPLRDKIASQNAAKSPMASVDGTYCNSAELSFDGIEISFNPKRMNTFCDAENYGVAYAEQVTILGHRCYARGNVRYFTESDAPVKVGAAPSASRFI